MTSRNNRRVIRRRDEGSGAIEMLEFRRLLTAVTVPCTSGADNVSIYENAGQLYVQVGGVITQQYSTSSVTSISVDAASGADIVEIENTITCPATILGGPGNDSLTGGGGNDNIGGGADHDTIHGGSGNDTIGGDAGNDRMYGWDGNDTMSGNLGDDVFFGEGGLADMADYSLTTTNQVLTINGDNDDGDPNVENDSIDWTIEKIVGGSGHDRITATVDTLHNSPAAVTLIGGTGNDTLGGGSLNDYLEGNAGIDAIFGDRGNDTLNGVSGGDYMRGGSQDDLLVGGSGQDTMDGDDGNDTLSALDGEVDAVSGSDGTDSATYDNGPVVFDAVGSVP